MIDMSYYTKVTYPLDIQMKPLLPSVNGYLPGKTPGRKHGENKTG
jgi:hypothetical protein